MARSATATAECPTLATVRVDVTALDPETYTDLRMDELYKSLLIRLLEERVAVVGHDERSDVTLRFERVRADRLRIEMMSNGVMRSDEVAITDKRVADSHLAILHACIELVRHGRAACDKPSVMASPETRSTSPAPESRGSAITVGAYVVYGAHRSALMSTASYELELAPLWRWTLRGFVLPPLNDPSHLSLFEWGAQTGLVFAPRLSSTWSWQTSAVVGFDRESYRFSPTQTLRQAGSRIDPVGTLQTGLTQRFAHDWAVTMSAGALGLPRSHVYTIDGVTRLHIPQLRLIAGLTLSYVWD